MPWKENYDKHRQHIKKQKHHFADKDPYSQSYDFSSCYMWMWELNCKEVSAPKNWCFQIVVLEKTLESPLDSEEINPEYSLEGLMLKLKLQYFGHQIRRADSLEKTLMLGKIEGRRRRGWQRMRWLNGITDSMDVWVNFRRWWRTGKLGMLQSTGLQIVGHDLASEWTTTMTIKKRASHVALVVKNPPANAGDARDMGSIPGWGDSLE